MFISTLRPGLLVSLSVTCQGNVSYRKVDLEREHIEDGVARAKWETTRTIADAAEFDAARKVQSEARAIVSNVCMWSNHGLLCPEANADILKDAVDRAQSVVDDFNATATITRVRLYVMTGRIASDDVEAVKRINSEVRQLMDDMARGMGNLDVGVIRDAAAKAKELGGMLTPDAQVRVQMAIETARNTAKAIVKAGEAAAIEVDTLAIRKITEARTAFLDMSDEIEIARPRSEARAIDLAPANGE